MSSNVQYTQPMHQEYSTQQNPSMSQGQIFGGDPVKGLPIDQNHPTTNELHLVNSLFTDTNRGTIDIILNEVKDAALIGILFIIISLPQIDEIIKKIIPITANSMYILLIIKALILISIWWLIKYFYLSRKS